MADANVGQDLDESPLLLVEDLDIVYQDVIDAVRSVSLQVHRGSVVTLLGPNGAGKTTTLRAITGLLPFHQGRVVNGSIHFDGRNITNTSASTLVRAGIAQALEGRRIFPGLTVRENIRVGAQGKLRDEALNRVLGLFPVLAERRDQRGGYLSGGEQQMLAMARALVAEPRLLVLDEPSLGLAPKIVDQVAELIVRINDEGTTVLVVEQNATVALEIADYVYILESGRLVVAGSTEELRAEADIARYYLGAVDHGEETGSYANIEHSRRGRRVF